VLLRLITGLEKPDSGEIFIRGENMKNVSPGDRNIGYVPQSFALYPHYKVSENIGYPLKLLGMKNTDIKPIVERTAEQLKITHLLNKKPDQCSGGEKQRIAIARGIVKNTEIFILDDPLTGLDFKLREQLFDDLRQMQDDLEATFVYTTSDALEALMLAEQVSIFDSGTIIETGKLAEVYAMPDHVRTMGLLGFPPANIFSGTLEQNGSGKICRTPLSEFSVAANGNGYTGEVSVAVRPQYIKINPAPDETLSQQDAEVTLVEDLGGEMVVYLEVGGLQLEAVVPHKETGEITEGPATIGVSPEALIVYDASGHHIGHGVD
jgi:ABC-type sugar transport system ATPase subunit